MFVGPDYPPARETMPADDVPRGELHELIMRSEDSKIYPGVARKPPVDGADPDLYDARFRGLGCRLEQFGQPEFDGVPGSQSRGDSSDGHSGHPMNADAATPDLYLPGVQPYERKVIVYVPHGLDRSTPTPFIAVLDGPGYVATMAPTLDTLIAERRIPALIAIFAASGGDDAQGSQRGLEYDTMSGVFAEFVDTEVVPFVEDRCAVCLTSDPDGRAVMGGSSGGSAAFTAAFYRPDLFRRVLTCKSALRLSLACNKTHL